MEAFTLAQSRCHHCFTLPPLVQSLERALLDSAALAACLHASQQVVTPAADSAAELGTGDEDLLLVISDVHSVLWEQVERLNEWMESPAIAARCLTCCLPATR